MNTERVYPPFKKVDRTGWSTGEWSSEPDRVEWRMMDRYCCVNRTRQGHWCGYIGLPEGHKCYGNEGVRYALGTEVHGGITISSKLNHIPSVAPWYIGFDCGHGGLDYQPGLPGPNEYYGDISYKSLFFTIAQLHILLAELEGCVDKLPLPKYTPTIIDDELVQLSPYKVGITGDGALMLKDWVRGNGNIGIGLDWIEEHPEYLEPKISREMFAELMTQLRECYK